jgi:steroid 5-alpha reductase family enzyme
MDNFGIIILGMLGYISVWYGFALYFKRNDIADIAWGPGIFLMSVLGIWITHAWSLLGILILILIGVWVVRLAWHIGRRVASHHQEDKRYQNFRTGWGKYQKLGSFLQVFLLQGSLMIVLALPVIMLGQAGEVMWSWWIVLPLGLWVLGFLFESIGDYQLGQFLKNKPAPDAIMNTGVWRFTRHPNYFGEVAMWWSVWIIVIISIPWSWSVFFVSILSPLTITYLLLYVSGIPLLEKKWQGNAQYAEYQKTTPALIPWFPRKYDKKTD